LLIYSTQKVGITLYTFFENKAIINAKLTQGYCNNEHRVNTFVTIK